MKITCTKRKIRGSHRATGRKIVAFDTLDSKRNAAKPYAYVTKHGIGPGTLPKDVNLVDYEDLDDYLTLIYVDRPLSSKELDAYEIYPETKTNAVLKQYGKRVGAATRNVRKYTVKAKADTKTYEITYDHFQDTVTVDSFESEQDAIDKLIDQLEAEGSTGCFVDPDECNEDEYVIGGNHCLALYTGGNFRIREVSGGVESATQNVRKFTVTASEYDEDLIDALWNACDDISGLMTIDYANDDSGILFIYEDATRDYESRESELISELERHGYSAEYVTNNGSNVIELQILRKTVGASTNRVRRYSVTAGMGGRPKAGNTVVTDKAYLTQLAKGIVRELEQDFDSVSYRITNDAIVFSIPDFDYEYIQPIDDVVTYDSDLASDIDVLYEDIYNDMMPGF